MPPVVYRSITLLMVLLLLPAVALAVRVDGLFRAEVEVVDKGSEARAEGFRRALEQVLVKVTGDSAVIEDPALEPLLATPARFVQQYRYERIKDAGQQPDVAPETDVQAEEAEPAPAYRLQVNFGRAQLERELRARELVVWGPYRPQVLVWLAYDDGRRRTLVAADPALEMDDVLREEARVRGLPLLLPLLDTEDQRRIDYLDVQGGFLDAVHAASERYRAGLVLVGHVYRGGGGWRGDWTLLEGDERRGWVTRSDAAEAAVRAGIDGLADRVAATLAGRESERRRVRVRVLDTENLEDYARLGQYFERLPRVDDRRVVQVRPRELLFELELRGRVEDLERAIALDDLLVPARPTPEAAATVAESDGTATATGLDPSSAATGMESGPSTAAGAFDTGPATIEGPPLAAPGDTGPIESEDELVYRLAG